MTRNREVAVLCKRAIKHGWTVTYTGGGHLRLAPPDGGAVVFAPSTPSDHRSVLNMRARLRRQGLPV